MPNRVYALLVGVNDYGPDVGSLDGCLNDVDLFHDHLKQVVEPASLAVEILKNGEATRANIIDGFRAHLRQARAGDVALFQFCGHGARWAANRIFRELYPGGKDEGLVCYDSRQDGGFDLADKELAVLVSEVARTEAHTAVLLDCCHSGSGTRGPDAFRGLKKRLTHEVTTERPLESYLNGYYAALRDAKAPMVIPTGRHVLLAACERGQLAQESGAHGVFTSTLVEVLAKSGGDLSYADLFVRCRAAVRSRAFDQDPQFETYGRFDAGQGFLARSLARASRRRYLAYCDLGVWTVECGAIHGVPVGPGNTVALSLFHEHDPATLAGTARAVLIGPQKSDLELDFESAEADRYVAEITSMPSAPMPVAFRGDEALQPSVQDALNAHGANVSLVGGSAAAQYALTAKDGRLTLAPLGRDLEIGFASLGGRPPERAAALFAPALQHVMQWERCLALQNHATAMDASQIELVYAEQLESGGEHTYEGNEVTLDYTQAGGEWRAIRGRFRVRNRTGQQLHVMLAYCSEAYGIHVLVNEPVETGNTWMTIWGDDPTHNFYLGDGVDESVERFKLLVSTEKTDGFLLEQDDLALGDDYGAARAIASVQPPRKVGYKNEWLTKDFRIRVVRRLDVLGHADRPIANGQIVVKGHPAVTANISLGAARSGARGTGSAAGFYKAFEERGLTLVNFAGTRGADLSVLELTDIRNASALKEQPLEIELKTPLPDDEGIVPVVFDGHHVFLGGHPSKEPDGTTRIVIDSVIDAADERRSLLGSLKLYFFKTVLKHERVNQLRWLEFTPDGAVRYRADGLAARLAGARRVLLLVHGITGDTIDMAAGVRTCGLDRQFDVVLTYDYENLSTKIEETARTLKTQLEAAGLRDADGVQLTLLVHSMGGLVSRWFIEREGGHRVVDHLVMCGTPNAGSPLGRVEDARKVFGMMTTVALNYLPALVPFSSAVLLLLNRSKRLTPTLEQMHPASEFISTLNRSDDPGIRYTILAGDVDTYQDSGDALFGRLIAKAGRSFVFDTLFANQANDIAVGVESILGVTGERRVPPVRSHVACHHMNYFVSEAGRQALRSVAW